MRPLLWHSFCSSLKWTYMLQSLHHCLYQGLLLRIVQLNFILQGNLPNSRSDQKSLKVRIKVGSDNIKAQRNAAIYSGLGLVTSPSSSSEDSPSECEGNFPESQETQGESPSSIIKVNFFQYFKYHVCISLCWTGFQSSRKMLRQTFPSKLIILHQVELQLQSSSDHPFHWGIIWNMIWSQQDGHSGIYVLQLQQQESSCKPNTAYQEPYFLFAQNPIAKEIVSIV
ncbi:unnamed protein product, partial [Vitis vinifera]